MRWFAYNGDADGICAMVIRGLIHGIEGERVTGVKRDIELLERVDAKPGDEVIVMDISLARNHERAKHLASIGVSMTWFDHHLQGEPIPEITSHIDTSANVCTALLVSRELGSGEDWAMAALHGDGLGAHSSRGDLAELGELLNYNGYGFSLDDLHFHPDELMVACLEAGSPEAFMQSETFLRLRTGFAEDITHCDGIEIVDGIHMLPDEPWARRVVGVYAHRLNQVESGPHVIAIDRGDTLQISVRGESGIGELCAKFGGGGRETAGGIDALPKGEIPALMNEISTRR